MVHRCLGSIVSHLLLTRQLFVKAEDGALALAALKGVAGAAATGCELTGSRRWWEDFGCGGGTTGGRAGGEVFLIVAGVVACTASAGVEVA